ncbi:hypothetical protein FACS1894132_14710 [Clostridia bacterium]|nr:hypothetical protein FACS1894132_14710 [Clostridia bacterium]
MNDLNLDELTLDDAVELYANGHYVYSYRRNEVDADYHEMSNHALKKGVDPMDLDPKEIEQFFYKS